MNAIFNASLEACAKLINAAGLLGFASSGKEECFSDGMPPSFTKAKWVNTWALVKGNKAPSHECSICRPWREGIGRPFS
jgi:hypothetical protein